MVTKRDLDPFRVIIGVVATKRNSDLLLGVAAAAGLRFDTSLSESADYSHTTRIRALMPRILQAYEALDESSAIAASDAVLAALANNPSLANDVSNALQRVGWDVVDSHLVAAEPQLREIFFPKGSRWDAHVVLRDLFAEAERELQVVDAYCDGTVLKLLAARNERPLAVGILCHKYAQGLAAEATAFCSQFPGWMIEVRRGHDFHDRFVVIDGSTCVHVGASINGAGKTAFMVSRIEDPANRQALLGQLSASWVAASCVT